MLFMTFLKNKMEKEVLESWLYDVGCVHAFNGCANMHIRVEVGEWGRRGPAYFTAVIFRCARAQTGSQLYGTAHFSKHLTEHGETSTPSQIASFCGEFLTKFTFDKLAHVLQSPAGVPVEVNNRFLPITSADLSITGDPYLRSFTSPLGVNAVHTSDISCRTSGSLAENYIFPACVLLQKRNVFFL